jgi:hypothetical protein
VTIVTAIIIWARHVALKKDALGSDRVNAFGGVR